ncbi:MAG: hypothetical protein ABIW76_16515 [Fibrobacteria bacterium]
MSGSSGSASEGFSGRNPPEPVSPWRQSLAAARANLIPGLVLQAFALVVLLAYYYHGPSHRALDLLANLKLHWGWRYSFCATALWGGLIPFFVLRLNPQTRASTPFSHGLFYVGFWAVKGVEVDLFYQAQGWMFGNDIALGTVAVKVLFDQFVYTVCWSAPGAQLAYYWKDAGFSFAKLRSLRWIRFLRINLPKALVSIWAVWLPAVTIIYALPPPLQVPLFNIVLCFHALLFATVNRANAD